MKKTFKSILAAFMAVASMSVGAMPISANECTANTEANGDTRYISYNCITGEETIIDMSKYECDVTSVESNMPSTRVVIGPDGREKVEDTTIAPFKGIGYLYCEMPSSISGARGSCSAFAANAAITAAHVVWDSNCDEYAENIQITFARSDDYKPYGTVTAQPTEIIIPEQYKNTQSTNYDYAILVYGTTISNYRFGFTSKSSATSVGTNVTVTGYPKDASTAIKNPDPNSHCQWTASGSITASTTYTISYEIDTTGGQSGAPVYNTTNQIVGIHHGGNSTSNIARKIDSTLFNLMYQIRNGTYTG